MIGDVNKLALSNVDLMAFANAPKKWHLQKNGMEWIEGAEKRGERTNRERDFIFSVLISALIGGIFQVFLALDPIFIEDKDKRFSLIHFKVTMWRNKI